jgi:hypothetical protein
MNTKLLVAASLLVISSWAAKADDWPQKEIDRALTTVAVAESGEQQCAEEAGTKITHEIIQQDVNGDGEAELRISSFPEELKNGSSVCFAPPGQSITLLRTDGAGGWVLEFRFDAVDVKYHPREGSEWPDVELVGGSVGVAGIMGCESTWRFHNGEYRPWKVCDDSGRLMFADVAPWMKAADAAPRDAAEAVGSADIPAARPERVNIKTLQGPEFDHNGSIVIVDHKRGMIVYKQPRKAIAGTIKAGDVLFKGEPWDQYEMGRSIRGTAYIFKKGCDPAPYRVEGGFRMSWHTIVLKGVAPVRAKGSCEVTGYNGDGNSSLEFQNLDD